MDTASKLAEKACGFGRNPYIQNPTHQAYLQDTAGRVRQKQLANVLVNGVGFHYAAMEPEDRSLMEKLFLDRALAVRQPASLSVLSLKRAKTFLCKSADLMYKLHSPAPGASSAVARHN